MQNFRPLLLIAWLFVAYLLWQAWADFQRPPAASLPSTGANVDGAPAPAVAANVEIPDAAQAPAAGAVPSAPASADATSPAADAAPAPARRVTVETDVLRLVIDTRGGSIVSAQMLAYPETLHATTPVELLNDDPARLFHAQSGLVSAAGAAPDHTAMYEAEQDRYTLAGDTIEVPLTWRGDNGIVVRKSFVLKRGDYAIEVRHAIRNEGAAPWTGSAYRQLQRVPLRTSAGFSLTDATAITFHGAAWYSPEERFEKRQFDDFVSEPLQRTITGGWAGLLQHYFFAAWIPGPQQANDFTTVRVPDSNRYIIRQVGAATTVAPGAEVVDSARLWVGPKLQNVLPDVADGLELTIDYGIFTVIAKPLFWTLDKLHGVVGNWGVAIILLTLLIKLAFYKLSEAQYRSMARMRKMQPRMAQLKERYGDDRQKMNAAMMELYKKEKINPLGGCLPMLVQIPVFIALYWVLLESVELRQAPFFGWIQDLSTRDPYFILPVLNGAVMWLTQKLSPTPGMDPIQKRIFQIMPIMFSVMFAFFPSGLVLYWLTNGALSLLQQTIITRRIDAGAKA
jgi:YidC/Oxa1 family membrane protein insertase